MHGRCPSALGSGGPSGWAGRQRGGSGSRRASAGTPGALPTWCPWPGPQGRRALDAPLTRNHLSGLSPAHVQGSVPQQGPLKRPAVAVTFRPAVQTPTRTSGQAPAPVVSERLPRPRRAPLSSQNWPVLLRGPPAGVPGPHRTSEWFWAVDQECTESQWSRSLEPEANI